MPPSSPAVRKEGIHIRPRKSGFRRLLIAMFAFHIFFCLPSCRRERADAAPMVPIILLSIDTLRADHLASYGYGLDTSPSIDEFARESVLFENAISPSPVTTPAHISLFTATTPVVHGRTNISAHKNKDYEPLPAGIISAVEVLKANGYITLGLHGGGNVEGLCGLKRGFDYYARVPDESLNSRLADLIQSYRTSTSPFFIFLHHYACHDPYTKGPKDLRLRFTKGRKDELASIVDEIEGLGLFAQRRLQFWKHFNLASPADRELVMALYDGGVLYSDSLFGETLDVLKREGLYDDALIIVLSDHGEEFFEHGGRLHSRLFIETLHVPLLIKFPHRKFSSRRVREEVRTFDLFPTVFDYLKIKPLPVSFLGLSFMPLILDRGTYHPSIMSFSPRGDRVRFHSQGLVFAHEPLNSVPYWVFDRKSDPLEKVNLADKKPELLRQMEYRSREIMGEHQQLAFLFRNKSGSRVEIDERVIEKLRALGYVK